MELFPRHNYLQQLMSKRCTPDIKIITGIRRAGKSKLMQMYMDYLREIDPSCNVIFVDLRLLQSETLKEYHALHDFVEKHYAPRVNNYVCIDEVQLCPQFELAINSLHATERFDIYLTGSNAFMLSSDLATLFTGRCIEIQVFPFSFAEFVHYVGHGGEVQSLLDRYVVEGGFSGSYLYANASDKTNYVREAYTTIIQRDLIAKYNLPDATMLSRLMEYMLDNVSNISSPNGISSSLRQNGFDISHVTVARYLDYIANSFLLYKIDRYDIKGKKYLQSLSKYYLTDSSIRYAVLGLRNMDWGRIYENLVCIELLRRKYRVYVGKLYQKEIDFVAMRGNDKIYIQVSDDISNTVTFEREYQPLLQIRDAYPRLIIARTRHQRYSYQGIQIVDLADWLLDLEMR